MAEPSRHSLGPIPAEWFDGDPSPRPGRRDRYSAEHNADLDQYFAGLKAQTAPPPTGSTG